MAKMFKNGKNDSNGKKIKIVKNWKNDKNGQKWQK